MHVRTVVGYSRISSISQEDGVSIAAQDRRIRSYCDAHELILVEIFTDQKSARDLDRPGLQAALELLEKGAAEGLVVSKLDRLTRSVRDAAALFDRFKKKSWGLAVIQDHLDTSSAYGEAMAVMGAVFSQLERRLIGERTRDGLAEVKAQGGKIGQLPYGLIRTAATDAAGRRVIETNPAETATIKFILTLRKNRLTLAEVAARLDRDPAHRTRRGARWTGRRVWSILAAHNQVRRRPAPEAPSLSELAQSPAAARTPPARPPGAQARSKATGGAHSENQNQ